MTEQKKYRFPMKPVLFYVYLSFFCTLGLPLNFLVCLDQQLQCLYRHLDGAAGVLAHFLVQARSLPLLVPDDVEAGAAASAQCRRHHKQGSGLHLTGLDAQALPALPLSLQLIIDRGFLRAMLTVKAVLALDHASM